MTKRPAKRTAAATPKKHEVFLAAQAASWTAPLPGKLLHEVFTHLLQPFKSPKHVVQRTGVAFTFKFCLEGWNPFRREFIVAVRL